MSKYRQSIRYGKLQLNKTFGIIFSLLNIKYLKMNLTDKPRRNSKGNAVEDKVQLRTQTGRRRSITSAPLGLPPGSSLQINGPSTRNQLLAHMTLGQHDESSSSTKNLPSTTNLHPAVAHFVLKSASFSNCGGARRCREMLLALREAMAQYRSAPGTAVCRHLDHFYLKPIVGAMVEARPMATSMANAVRALRLHVSLLPPETLEHDAQVSVINFIDSFIANRLDAAADLIVANGLSKIVDNDVILTFGHSNVVVKLLLAAHSKGIIFRVIVVDARPFNEGKRTLEILAEAGISCTFLPLTAIGYALTMLREVRKTIVGAAAMTANGTLVSRIGTAAVCSLSNRAGVPVIVCCETVKFTDRTQTDPLIASESADPDLLTTAPLITSAFNKLEIPSHHGTHTSNTNSATNKNILDGWKKRLPSLHILNPLYDATSPHFLTVVITEIGLIPPTSIPVVLREYSSCAVNNGNGGTRSASSKL